MKPFLILQLRPHEDGDYEYAAFMKYGGLEEKDTRRIEMTKEHVPTDINFADYSGVIVGGGGVCVSDKERTQDESRFIEELAVLMRRVVEEDFPYLGACFGFGFLADYVGGKVTKDPACAETVEAVDITLTEEGRNDPLLEGLPETFKAFVGHKESCVQLPANAVWLASSKKCPNHMFRVKNNIYATQFHPELDVENLIVRIQIYKHAGYFPPEDAEKLIENAKKEEITVPMLIMKRFIDRYKKE